MVNRVKQYLYRKYLSIKYEVKFKTNVKVNRNVSFEGGNYIYNNTQFIDSTLGYGSYIANNSIIRSTKIGRFCAIGDNVRTGLGLHPTQEFVSIHPAFFSINKQAGFTFANKQLFKEHKYVDEDEMYFVVIGNDVWIGNDVNIMDGVKVGDGAILAAGAIVTQNIEPYAIYGGVPAKLIKYRFDEETRKFLLSFRWWDKKIEWLEDNWSRFNDINAFASKFKK
jgi:acetyltransferase-like isoleucine patch superfamily enzyme